MAGRKYKLLKKLTINKNSYRIRREKGFVYIFKLQGAEYGGRLNMIRKINMIASKIYPKRTACPECGAPQIFRWDSVDDGKNIILTFSHNHEDKVQKKQFKEVA